MKKFTLCLMTAFLSLTFMPTQSNAAVKRVSTTITEPTKIDSLQARISEIKAMDRSNLSSPVKKELRKETRELKTQVSDLGGGVYISVGAIIIILLLIIILL